DRKAQRKQDRGSVGNSGRRGGTIKATPRGERMSDENKPDSLNPLAAILLGSSDGFPRLQALADICNTPERREIALLKDQVRLLTQEVELYRKSDTEHLAELLHTLQLLSDIENSYSRELERL